MHLVLYKVFLGVILSVYMIGEANDSWTGRILSAFSALRVPAFAVRRSNGKVEFVNPAFGALAGLAPETLIGMPAGNLFPDFPESPQNRPQQEMLLVRADCTEVRLTCSTKVVGDLALCKVADQELPLIDEAKGRGNIFHEIKEIFFTADRSGQVVNTNKAFDAFRSRILPQGDRCTVGQLAECCDQPRLSENIMKCIREGVSIEQDAYFPAADKWLSFVMIPTASGAGILAYDITGKKRSAERLSANEKKFHLMADNSPMFVWTADNNLRPTFFNKKFTAFTGLSFHKLLTADWLPLVHTDDRTCVDDALALASGKQCHMEFECRILRHDGLYCWVKMLVVPRTEDGQVKEFLGSGADISELKHFVNLVEAKNRELQQAFDESDRLSGLLYKTSNLVITTDLDGNITWFNEAFAKLFSYQTDHVLGAPLQATVFGPETERSAVDMVEECIRNREPLRVEMLLYGNGANRLWIDLRMEPIFRNHAVDGFLVVLIDISRKKNDELAIKERNDKLKEFSFITSHELRHEFSKILMVINMAKTVDDLEGRREMVAHLEDPVGRINQTLARINDALNLSPRDKKPGALRDNVGKLDEICLVDDDRLTNMVHRQMVKVTMPGTNVRVFEDIESCIRYMKVSPSDRRLVLLDLNFPNGKTGWDFLDEAGSQSLDGSVVILSSSIDPDDVNKSKQYPKVLDYIVKPLTTNTLNQISGLEA
jgi:PAS domain S-box-containing protein